MAKETKKKKATFDTGPTDSRGFVPDSERDDSDNKKSSNN